MKFTIASTLLALALPLVAQESTQETPSQQPKVAAAEAMFYKAYYLEKGDRKFEEAVSLYQAFLAKAPEHKLASVAAKQNFRLLDRMGKTKERDAFKAKFEKLLGNVANVSSRPQRPGRGEGQAGERRPGGGERGRGRGRGRGIFGMLRGDTKIADMDEQQLAQLKEGLAGSDEMIDRMRRFMGDEVADKLEKGAKAMKTALDAGKTDEAQKALEELRKAMPRRRGRGRGRDGEEGGNRRRGEGGRPAGAGAGGGGAGGKVEAGKKKAGGGGGGGGR